MPNFIDEVSVRVEAGRGGDGVVSWRREKYVDRGGPDGGDGGNGGDVILKGDNNLNTLQKFRFNPLIKAVPGESGKKQRKHGKNGDNYVVSVPVGTQVFRDQVLIADITAQGQEFVAAGGGRGGFGNAHFKSSTRQAPKIAERGEPGEKAELKLELKLLADVGLVGLPNAGKSTFLSVVSNARPQIADYPFTTLEPNLGVVDFAKQSILIADIPGLIEGASKGKGLGDDFLRHIERTAVIIQLVDAYSTKPATDFKVIRKELQNYKMDLSTKPFVVAVTKIDGLDPKRVTSVINKLKKLTTEPIIPISSHTKEGVKELLASTHKLVIKQRKAVQAVEKADVKDDSTLIYELDPEEEAWKITRRHGRWQIKGKKIEGFALRTDPDNEWSVYRLSDIMRKMGIMRELARRGAKAEESVKIGEIEIIL